ncbi:Signal transduction histidine kinase [Ferrithrix thermotolerans DSM 19514]|uniref:histidine kinase n=1 Tax=Ferrithrix thermotolerans DSM 19514 TaxID=1121881 RepID=A0A1M4SA67_9ACTN|nr:GAF domain-containing sensor histidine kinase [Ferrithrix thermotolerans]SHE29090.1 Signal transduction histidine kinase [Ferrithrix thermotolerans DSM 19514]
MTTTDLYGSSQLRLVRAIAEAMSLQLDLSQLAARVAELVAEAVEADVCFVHMVNAERGTVSLIGATPPFDSQVGAVELPLGEGIAGWVARNRVPAVVPNKWEDRRYRYIPELKGEDYKSLISVPMLRGSDVAVGVINVHWRESVEDLEYRVYPLKDVANLFAGAVENAVLHARILQRESEISSFAKSMLSATEMERRRVANEVHDGVGQVLLSLMFHLDAASSVAPRGEEELISELTRSKELANMAVSEVRRVISALRPTVIDDFGLPGALEFLKRIYPSLDISLDVGEIGEISPEVEVTLYRVAQEALTNVNKHSGATSATIKLKKFGNEIVLTVLDHGKGFDASAARKLESFGILGMKERVELLGGRLDVYSRPGGGTTVFAHLPAAQS